MLAHAERARDTRDEFLTYWLAVSTAHEGEEHDPHNLDHCNRNLDELGAGKGEAMKKPAIRKAAKHVHDWRRQPMEDWVCSLRPRGAAFVADETWCGGTVAYVCQHPDCTECRCAKHDPRKPARYPGVARSTDILADHLAERLPDHSEQYCTEPTCWAVVPRAVCAWHRKHPPRARKAKP